MGEEKDDKLQKLERKKKEKITRHKKYSSGQYNSI